MPPIDFKKAREVNAIYGDTYGSRKAPDNPEWYGIAGDVAAKVRASYPTPKTESYFRSRQRNQYINMLISTGNQGRAPPRLGDYTVLDTTDDITPKAIFETNYNVGNETDHMEYLMAGILIAGAIAFILMTR